MDLFIIYYRDTAKHKKGEQAGHGEQQRGMEKGAILFHVACCLYLEMGHNLGFLVVLVDG